jgi:hypothetical protein
MREAFTSAPIKMLILLRYIHISKAMIPPRLPYTFE